MKRFLLLMIVSVAMRVNANVTSQLRFKQLKITCQSGLAHLEVEVAGHGIEYTY